MSFIHISDGWMLKLIVLYNLSKIDEKDLLHIYLKSCNDIYTHIKLRDILSH